MPGESAEDRARRAVEAKSQKEGQEMQQYQQLQSSIQEIQGEQKNNLMAARMGAEGDARENQAMLQAAELGMLGAGAGAVAVDNATPVQQTSPQTQAILSKYGVGKPKNQTTTTRSVQQTPTKITINNNTTNNTTNNVAVPPSNQGPVQGRAVTIKQQPDQGQARFKTWINNAFARQNQAAVQREKEYQRREWSLSRTTGKLMKKLQELGTTISERMDPRKLTSTVGNQLKTLLFIFGARFLAKNWDKVLDGLAKLEYFFIGEPGKEGGERGKSGLAKMLIRVFGGDPNDSKASIGKTIKDFFYTGDKNKAGVFDLVLEKIKHFFEIRSEAVKAIQPPKLDFSNIGETLTSMLGYLGDILKVMMSGPEAAKEGIIKSINRNAYGISSSDDRMKEGEYDIYKTKPEKGALLGSGGAVALKGKNYLNEEDFDSNGNLRNTASATISQARDIDRFERIAKETGEVNITPIIQGYQRLKDAAEKNKNKKIVVDSDWIKNKINNPEVYDNLVNSGDIITRKYRLVKRPRTKDELNDLAAGKDFLTAGITQYAVDEVAGDYLKKTGVDIIRGRGDLAAKRALYDVVTLGNIGGAGDMLLALDEGQSSSAKKKAIEENKVFDIYPVDEKLPEGWELPNYKHLRDKIFEYSEVSSRAINEIIRGLTGKDIEIDNTNMNYISSMQEYVEKLASNNSDGNEITYGKGQDIIGDIEKISELDEKENEYRKIEEQHLNTSNVKKAFDNTKEMVTDAVNSVFGGGSSTDEKSNSGKFEPGKLTTKKISKEESERNIQKVLDFFTSKGLTPEQAAGIAGVFHYESAGMNPEAINEYEKNKGYKGYGRGLAQWSNERPFDFAKWHEKNYGEYLTPEYAGIDKQLEFAWHEMNQRPAFMKAIQAAKTVEEATDVTIRGYENGGSRKLATPADINGHEGYQATGDNYTKMMEARVPRGLKIYQQFFNKEEEKEQETPETTTQPDASGTYITQNTTTPVWTKDGVEIGGQTYNPEVGDALAFNSWAGYGRNIVFNPSLNAMNMADNNIISPIVEPDNVSQVSTTKSSIPVGSSTIKTAGDIVTNNNTDNLLAGISDNLLKLNNSFSVIPKGQLAQIEAINILTQTMANIPVGSPTSGRELKQVSKEGFTITPSTGVG